MVKRSTGPGWLLKMAWRDSRRSRLVLFTSSIILGIAALVSINSFRDNLLNDINDQAKELLGADLRISSTIEIRKELLFPFDSAFIQKSRETYFASMIYFPKTDGTRLVQIRALEGNFPFYGKIETDPPIAESDFRNKQMALVDATLMLQYDVVVGDTVRVGNLGFTIAGKLQKVPGQSGISSTVAPVVYIPHQYLEQTGLIKKGSRIRYQYFYQASSSQQAQTVLDANEKKLDDLGVDTETVEDRKEDTGDSFTNLGNFLNLVAFIALLLGCVGVASSVHIYIKEKITTVAVLRCLGLKGRQAFLIYLYQIAIMGLLGAVVGTALGSLIQSFLPEIFSDFLPIEVSMALSWSSIAQGITIGVCMAVLFALIPLLEIRNISPLRTLRASYEVKNDKRDYLRIAVYILIFLFILGFSILQIEDIQESVFYSGGIFMAFGILALVGKLIMWFVRKNFPVSWGYIWRQSLANLYRPNNQTITLIVSIGLGTALISMLYFVQDILVDKVAVSGGGDRPNMVLFDIQSHQKDEIAEITLDYDLPIIQQVPIVTMRLVGINGLTKEEVSEDTTVNYRQRSFNREYRVTYRDSLISSEKLIEGEWHGSVKSPNDTIYISLSDGSANSMGVEIGDKLTFNVQGAIISTVVGSLREVDWNRVQTNFRMVFPAGVLEEAPQFHVLVTKVESNDMSARYQQAIVRQFPNVSIIDLSLILNTLDVILGKISFVIRFMAMFSIVTGLLVLIGSVIISKFQRIQESVLLRTLGASKKQIFGITALEYMFLGSIAAFSGIILALLGSWALAVFSFEMAFIPNFFPAVILFVIIAGLTVFIGLLNSRSIIQKTPLEVLRAET
ncbi:MAG: FtsX-like permease family protein [Bacteroidetes bacterium]|nr:FtsX-like permease family protein [Bacteroidota bacterium]MDA1118921.1 FtsX-like permease family protein [Bacteroidota bacterium]